MAEYTPTTAQVRDCFVDGAAGDFIEEDFDRWLAQHDAELRAEVERLRGVERGWQHDRAEWERERDEARQQLADLRAGIEALLPGETVNVYAGGGNLVSQRRVVNPDHLRTLLAESGEQPGEGRGPVRDGWCCWTCADLAAAAGPAPMVPDSAGLRERAIEAGVKAVEASPHGRWLVMPGPVSIQRQVAALITDAVLAVVGQSVTDCNCGFGGQRDPANPRCRANRAAEERTNDDR